MIRTEMCGIGAPVYLPVTCLSQYLHREVPILLTVSHVMA